MKASPTRNVGPHSAASRAISELPTSANLAVDGSVPSIAARDISARTRSSIRAGLEASVGDPPETVLLILFFIMMVAIVIAAGIVMLSVLWPM